MANGSLGPETLARVAEWTRIFGIAVRKAQEESRRMGVPNVYSIDGKIVYELPNGERVNELPPEYQWGRNAAQCQRAEKPNGQHPPSG